MCSIWNNGILSHNKCTLIENVSRYNEEKKRKTVKHTHTHTSARANRRYTSDMMQFMTTPDDNEGRKKRKEKKSKPPTLHVQWSAIHFIQWYFKIKCAGCVMKTLSNVINLEWLR